MANLLKIFLFSMALGLFFVTNLLSADSRNDTFYAFINGGYSSDSNTWIHEQDILSFEHGLFLDRPAKILSASGADAKFVEVDGNGNFLRKPDNYVELKPSQATGSIEAATLDNVRALYQNLATEKPSPAQAVLVYGDHGGDHGLALWGGNFLSTDEHFSLTAKFPKETLVRSIYLQCFAGSMLVDQSRILPTNSNMLLPFVDKYYAPNKCGMAMSRHNEIGQYNINGHGWQDSQWTHYLKGLNPPTLAGLKRELSEDDSVAPTPVLTSDYFIDDMSDFICKRLASVKNMSDVLSNIAACPTSVDQHGTLFGPALSEFGKELCEPSDLAAKVAAQKKELNTNFNAWVAYQGIVRYWASTYLNTKYPPEKIKALQSIEYYQYQADIEKDPRKKKEFLKTAEDNRRLIGPDFAKNYDGDLSRLVHFQDPAFNKFYSEQCSREWLAGDDPKKILMPEQYAGLEAHKATTATCLGDTKNLESQRPQILAKGKQLNLALSDRRTAVMNELFKDNRLKPLKDRYETIKRCEASALN